MKHLWLLLVASVAWGQGTPISGRAPAILPLTGNEWVPMTQGAANVKAQVKSWPSSGGGGSTTCTISLTAPSIFNVAGSPAACNGGFTLTLSGIPLGVLYGGTGATSFSGVLKGNGTSAFSTASDTDVISLWTGGGTCSSTTYLRGDGQCQTPAGTGTLTSVAATVPPFLTVTGSPITSAGTLAFAYSGVALPVGAGGTGALSLNGLLKGNGTGSPITSALFGDVTGLWTGGCSSTTFLRGDGQCVAAGGGSSTLNPFSLLGNPTGSTAAGISVGLGNNISMAGGILSAYQNATLHTATTYTVLTTDAGNQLQFCNSAPIAVTIPSGVTLGAGFAIDVQNEKNTLAACSGTGAVTITPASGTIGGAANLVVAFNAGCTITSNGTTDLQLTACTAISAGVAPLFSAIQGGVNTTANMQVGLGGSVSSAGGPITATAGSLYFPIGTSLNPSTQPAITGTGTFSAGATTWTCVTGCAGLADGMGMVTASDGTHVIYPLQNGQLGATITNISGSTITMSFASNASTTPGTYAFQIGRTRYNATSAELVNTLGMNQIYGGAAANGNTTWAFQYLGNECDYIATNCFLMDANSRGASVAINTFSGARTSDSLSATGNVQANTELLVVDNSTVSTGAVGNSWLDYTQVMVLPTASASGNASTTSEEKSFFNGGTYVTNDPWDTIPTGATHVLALDCGQPGQAFSTNNCTDAISITGLRATSVTAGIGTGTSTWVGTVSTITVTGATAQPEAGQEISATGIPSGAQIASNPTGSCASSCTVPMTQTTTGSEAGVTVTFGALRNGLSQPIVISPYALDYTTSYNPNAIALPAAPNGAGAAVSWYSTKGKLAYQIFSNSVSTSGVPNYLALQDTSITFGNSGTSYTVLGTGGSLTEYSTGSAASLVARRTDNLSAGPEGQVVFQGENSSVANVTFAAVVGSAVSNTAGSEAGSLKLQVVAAGTLTTVATLSPTNLLLAVPIADGGTKFTAAGSGGGCGTLGTKTGGALAGKFVAGAVTACQVTITFGGGYTAPNDTSCFASDTTTPTDLPTSITSTATTVTINYGTIVSGDTLKWGCVSY